MITDEIILTDLLEWYTELIFQVQHGEKFYAWNHEEWTPIELKH